MAKGPKGPKGPPNGAPPQKGAPSGSPPQTAPQGSPSGPPPRKGPDASPKDSPNGSPPEKAPRCSTGSRKSLSDWYGGGSDCGNSPREGSPPKKSRKEPSGDYFIGGDDSEDGGSPGRRATAPGELLMTPRGLPRRGGAGEASVRSLCAAYVEEAVAPTLRRLEQAQEQLAAQLRGDAPSAWLEELVAREAERTTLAQLRTLSAALEGSLDPHVMSFAEKRTLFGAQESPVGGEASPATGQLAAMAVSIRKALAPAEERGDPGAQARKLVEDSQAKLRGEVDALVEASQAKQRGEFDALRADLKKVQLLLAAAGQRFDKIDRQLVSGERPDAPAAEKPAEKVGAEKSSEMRKMQIVVAAAGARFDKQLREVRQQVKELRDSVRESGSPGAVGERWPGRVLGGAPSPMSDAASEAGRSDTGSLAGSVTSCHQSLSGSICGSACGSVLGAEELAEIKRIQAIVGAAGTAFTREMRDMRNQVSEMRKEMRGMQEALGGRAAAAAAA